MDIKRTNFKFLNEDKYITMTRGDTFSFGIELLDENGEAFTTDLASAFFTCKHNHTDVANVFRKSLGDGISKIANGQYAVRVAPADTEDIEAGKYFYDLQIGVNSDVFTILKGVLEIEQDVTGGAE